MPITLVAHAEGHDDDRRYRLTAEAANIRNVLTEITFTPDTDNEGAFLVRAADILPVLLYGIWIEDGLRLPPIHSNRIADTVFNP